MTKHSKLTRRILTIIAATTVALPMMGYEWGTTPRLHVEGNRLVNTEGENVMLCGVMDTPHPYFNSWRWGWNANDAAIPQCKNYFEKLFTAITDTEQGAWCNVFRLHLDPIWTNDPNANWTDEEHALGEACIAHFKEDRLRTYMEKLYYPLAQQAQAHGLYVIMRPPGVCPHTIKVGGEYQQYLTTVWDIVTQNTNVLESSDWLSIELANEPVEVLDANGNSSPQALHDFFQPIVDKIRENGFDGIIWVPGSGWQSNYSSYAAYPITGENIGYAVHNYPGWYNTSDEHYDHTTAIRSFLNSVPVLKTNPVMITEVDWSPVNPDAEGHYNEHGDWVQPNYGTWATASTSKWGMAYKAILDYFGNIGMTLTGTGDYLDIDRYINTGVVAPAFGGIEEACAAACFDWYNEYAHSEHIVREWGDEEDELFPLTTMGFDPCIWENGTFDEETGRLQTGQYGFGGWKFAGGVDLSEYNYIVIELKQPAQNAGDWSPSFRLFDKDNYWTSPYCTNLGGQTTIAVPLHNQKNDDGTAFDPSHVFIAGFWTLGSEPIYINNVFVSMDGISPAGIEATNEDNAKPIAIYDINGERLKDMKRGINIIKMSDGRTIKITK